eukprot:TRINITY_DN2203_c0_g2_i1.p2 TRINITY_DN2203_c0_g2~~TRINITY_DN2203_c0_g2_i1.p2  ORF type:complete len:293 (+),score=-15.42 TRINITY_DN2203_c0_g2_i1:2080-2958(+)
MPKAQIKSTQCIYCTTNSNATIVISKNAQILVKQMYFCLYVQICMLIAIKASKKNLGKYNEDALKNQSELESVQKDKLLTYESVQIVIACTYFVRTKDGKRMYGNYSYWHNLHVYIHTLLVQKQSRLWSKIQPWEDQTTTIPKSFTNKVAPQSMYQIRKNNSYSQRVRMHIKAYRQTHTNILASITNIFYPYKSQQNVGHKVQLSSRVKYLDTISYGQLQVKSLQCESMYYTQLMHIKASSYMSYRIYTNILYTQRIDDLQKSRQFLMNLLVGQNQLLNPSQRYFLTAIITI